MQCTPDFCGDPEQLDAFLYQVKFFADKIPAEGHTHASLINVVTLKLKGAARSHIRHLKAKIFDELKENLTKTFRTEISMEEIMQKVETLAREVTKYSRNMLPGPQTSNYTLTCSSTTKSKMKHQPKHPL